MNRFNIDKSPSHCLQRMTLSGGSSSSQPYFFLHNSCNINLAGRTNGHNNPRGSYTELTTLSSVVTVVDFPFSVGFGSVLEENLGFGFGFPAPGVLISQSPRDALQLPIPAVH